MEKNFYLITTEHLCDRIWFKDAEDFKVGMNYVAIVAHVAHIKVQSFILMSNHVHFVLYSTYDEAVMFINEFKRRYSKYYRWRHGASEVLRRNGVDIRLVNNENESLERAIAYVHSNSVAAGIVAHASQYAWGSGSAFFTTGPQTGSCIGDLSKNARIALLHSETTIPPEYILSPDGYILPCSYVNVKFVEVLYRNPRRYNFFLTNSSKARVKLEKEPLPAFRDQIILAAIPDLCLSLFRKNSISSLELQEKAELLKQLRYRFSADASQLARVTELQYNEVADLLEQY